MSTDTKNIVIGKIPDRKALKNVGEGANRVNSLSLTKQSNDTNGVDVDPSLSAGVNN